MDSIQGEATGLPDDFRQAAAPAERRKRVTLELDADIVEFMQAEGQNWKRQVNDLLRFFKDTSESRAAAFEPDAWEPGEMSPAAMVPA